MAFDILGIQELGSTESFGGMLPLPAAAPTYVVAEPLDGNDPNWFVATAVSSRVGIPGKLRTVSEARKVRANVGITNQRVVVACEKYDKGGGWVGVGGLGAAVVSAGINVASKTAASKRRQGTVLTGQVRYQWLRTVGYFSRQSLPFRAEIVRLGISDGTHDPLRPMWLHIELPTNVSAAKVAAYIVREAVEFWRFLDLVPDEHRAALEALPTSTPTPVREAIDTWHHYEFPYHLRAQPSTALPRG